MVVWSIGLISPIKLFSMPHNTHTNIISHALRQLVDLTSLIALLTVIIYPEPSLALTTEMAQAHTAETILRDLAHAAAPPDAQQTPAVAGIQSTSTLTADTRLTVTATAYSSTPDQTDSDPFTTASGKPVAPGTIAANFLPLGTRVKIGRRIYTVTDRMNARFSNQHIIDVWLPAREHAIGFGVQRLEITIINIPK